MALLPALLALCFALAACGASSAKSPVASAPALPGLGISDKQVAELASRQESIGTQAIERQLSVEALADSYIGTVVTADYFKNWERSNWVMMKKSFPKSFPKSSKLLATSGVAALTDIPYVEQSSINGSTLTLVSAGGSGGVAKYNENLKREIKFKYVGGKWLVNDVVVSILPKDQPLVGP